MNECFCVNNYSVKISIKRTSKMSDGRKPILSPFMGVKRENLGIRLEKNICP